MRISVSLMRSDVLLYNERKTQDCSKTGSQLIAIIAPIKIEAMT